MATVTTAKKPRYYWVFVHTRWFVGEAAYSSPEKGVYLPGYSQVTTPEKVGPEVRYEPEAQSEPASTSL